MLYFGCFFENSEERLTTIIELSSIFGVVCEDRDGMSGGGGGGGGGGGSGGGGGGGGSGVRNREGS